MEKYIKQLIEDIQNAHRQLTKEETEKAQTIEQHIEEVERYIAGEEDLIQQPFSYHCGLEKEQFPPINRLTFEQMDSVCKAFKSLLFSWNVQADFPDELPVDRAYETLVSVLDRKFIISISGFVGLEFCDYAPEECVFKEHCTCKVMFEELDEEERQKEAQVRQLLKILESALQKIPKGTTFSTLYHLAPGESNLPDDLHPIAEWIAINIADFPRQPSFNFDQLEAISDAILAFWDKEDDIQIWLRSVSPPTRYRALLTFLETKVWCTEEGHFIAPPTDPEELENIKNPLDHLYLKDLLDISEEDLEDDLPF